MAHSSHDKVTIEPADARHALLLGNLLELYIHDLSAIFPHVRMGEDGRYGYRALPSYLSGESGRRAFLIRQEGCVAGFVLAQRGSPESDDPSVQDIAEFFVLRQFRGRGVGRAAVTLLWDLMPGSWAIRASRANPHAVRFWRDVVANYTDRRGAESESASPWVVLCFDNSPEAPGRRGRVDK
jgi:predicted acetyltransferase